MFSKPQERIYNGSTVDYYWHSVSKKTIIQSLILGLVVGPIVHLLTHNGLVWCMFAMALAPVIVDFMRPTIVLRR